MVGKAEIFIKLVKVGLKIATSISKHQSSSTPQGKRRVTREQVLAEEREAKRRAAADREKAATEERQKNRATYLSVTSVFLDVVRAGGFVCVDSNIWMSRACEPALRCMGERLTADGAVLHMRGEQFAEIENKKRSPADESAQRKARHACRVIEHLTGERSIAIERIVNVGAAHDFDSYLVAEVERIIAGKTGELRVCVVTRDRGLKSRLVSMGTLHGSELVTVLGRRAFTEAFSEGEATVNDEDND